MENFKINKPTILEKAKGLGKKALLVGSLLMNTENAVAQNSPSGTVSDKNKIELDSSQVKKPIQVYESFSLATNPGKIHWEDREMGGSDFHAPFVENIEKIRNSNSYPNLDPNDFQDRTSFMSAYVEKMGQYWNSAGGQEEIKFRNDYYNGKKEFYQNKIEEYTKNPEKFHGELITNEMDAGGFYNRQENDLQEYLDYCKSRIEDIDDGGRTMEPPTEEELTSDAVTDWDALRKK